MLAHFQELTGTEDDYTMNSLIAEMMGGDVPTGFSEEDILRLTTEVEASHTDPVLCVICQEDVASPTPLLTITQCRHTFCKSCLLQWLQQKKKCPTCNVEPQL